jgi:DNA-binding transcriptional ArsR family regulator
MSSWAIFCVTFFRKGISRKWKELGFDKEVFHLMINMRGGKSRQMLLNYLGEPRQRAELSRLSGLDWKEVDREIDLLQRFGLITLYAQSGSMKLYKLSEQGKLMLKLIMELRERLPSEILNPQLKPK